jgi:hypothetical protein
MRCNVNRQANSTTSGAKKDSAWRDPAQRAELENKLRQRIEGNPQAKKYFAYLTGPAGFNPHYVIGSLVRDAFGYEVPTALSANPDIDFLKDYGPSELPRRARVLAKEIEEAESGTPNFGLDQLDNERLRTAEGRENAVMDLNKLPETLRLYADYFECSRKFWRALGRVTRDAKQQLERGVRDRLQREIHRRTGKYSDLRYSRLVNLAREVVGKNPLDEKALLARRMRRLSSR